VASSPLVISSSSKRHDRRLRARVPKPGGGTHRQISGADVLEALSNLGTTLVEDSVADSTLTYHESLSQPERESGSDAD
jgi:hypothetical protein